ncbi:unnamed protein product [Spodoptera exigua]|nr:unnamed protein product [Spodoptera exigua]
MKTKFLYICIKCRICLCKQKRKKNTNVKCVNTWYKKCIIFNVINACMCDLYELILNVFIKTDRDSLLEDGAINNQKK